MISTGGPILCGKSPVFRGPIESPDLYTGIFIFIYNNIYLYIYTIIYIILYILHTMISQLYLHSGVSIPIVVGVIHKSHPKSSHLHPLHIYV